MADITKRLPDCDDCEGERGKRGERGHRGHRGHTGSTGPTGPTGPVGVGAIIPFASGPPVALSHVIGGLLDTGALLAFGTSFAGPTVVVDNGAPIVVTALNNEAFSMPRDGTITSLSALLSTTVGLTLLNTTMDVIVQVYRSTGANLATNTFVAVPGALVTLSPLTGFVVPSGTVLNGTSGPLAIPVLNQDRLLLVARATVSGGTDVATTVTAYISAGLSIA